MLLTPDQIGEICGLFRPGRWNPDCRKKLSQFTGWGHCRAEDFLGDISSTRGLKAILEEKIRLTETGVVESVEAIHHGNTQEKAYFGDSYGEHHARLVIWAIVTGGKRVWLRTVRGLDSTKVKIKMTAAQEFFNGLIGHTISFELHDGKYFVDKLSLPEQFQVGTFPKFKRMTEGRA